MAGIAKIIYCFTLPPKSKKDKKEKEKDETMGWNSDDNANLEEYRQDNPVLVPMSEDKVLVSVNIYKKFYNYTYLFFLIRSPKIATSWYR